MIPVEHDDATAIHRLQEDAMEIRRAIIALQSALERYDPPAMALYAPGSRFPGLLSAQTGVESLIRALLAESESL